MKTIKPLANGDGGWGVTGRSDNKPPDYDYDRLSPLGLTCTGGYMRTDIGMTYFVSNKSKTIDVELTAEEFKNLEKTFPSLFRKEKLKRLETI